MTRATITLTQYEMLVNLLKNYQNPSPEIYLNDYLARLGIGVAPRDQWLSLSDRQIKLMIFLSNLLSGNSEVSLEAFYNLSCHAGQSRFGWTEFSIYTRANFDNDINVLGQHSLIMSSPNNTLEIVYLSQNSILPTPSSSSSSTSAVLNSLSASLLDGQRKRRHADEVEPQSDIATLKAELAQVQAENKEIKAGQQKMQNELADLRLKLTVLSGGLASVNRDQELLSKKQKTPITQEEAKEIKSSLEELVKSQIVTEAIFKASGYGSAIDFKNANSKLDHLPPVIGKLPTQGEGNLPVDEQKAREFSSPERPLKNPNSSPNSGFDSISRSRPDVMKKHLTFSPSNSSVSFHFGVNVAPKVSDLNLDPLSQVPEFEWEMYGSVLQSDNAADGVKYQKRC